MRVERSYVSKYPLLCFFGFFLLEFLISYLQIFKEFGGANSDVLSHIELIEKIGHLNLPEMGFEYTVFSLSKISSLNYQWVSSLLLSFCVGAQAYITYFLLVALTKKSETTCLFFTFISMICTAIYIPYFNHSLNRAHIYEKLNHYFLLHPHSLEINKAIAGVVGFFSHYALWGVGSPTVWHSPTFIIIKLMGLIITCLYISDIAKNMKNTVVISIFLMLSCFYKPSFAMIFIPAVFVYELFFKKSISITSLRRIIVIVLPSTILLGTMLFVLNHFYKTPEGHQSHIYFAPFAVMHLFVKNAFGAAIETLAFPLLILFIRFKEIFLNNKYLVFSWIMLSFGYLFWALLAQSGSYFFASENFLWGYDLGLSFVYIFSIVEFIKFATAVIHDKKVALPIPYQAMIYLCAAGFALSLSFVSGIVYLLKILLNIPSV